MRIQFTVFAEHDSYKTPDSHDRTLKAKLLPAQVVFVLHMLSVVFRASHDAKRNRYSDASWMESSLHVLRGLEDCGCTFDISGMNALHQVEGPVVFISNHMSTAETFLLPILIQPVKPCTFVVKPSLTTYPVFGHVMRTRNPVIVSRDNPREDLRIVLEEGRKRIENGISVILFPQTTRTTEFYPDKFNSLGVKLAKNAGVPIIPIALKTDAWSNGKYLKDFGKLDPAKTLHFSFGHPMKVEGTGKAEQEMIVQHITNKLLEWQS